MFQALKSARTALDTAVSTRVMATAGRIKRATPDINLDTGRLANRLAELPARARQRVAGQVERLDAGTWRTLKDADVEATKAATVIKYNGKAGREALEALGEGAKVRLLRLADDIKTERALIRAWENGEISTRELAKAVKNFDSLDAEAQQGSRVLLRNTGDDGADLLAQLDTDTAETVLDPKPPVRTDGGGIADELARALDQSDIDNPDQWIDSNIRSLDDTLQDRAYELIEESDGAGVNLIEEFNSDSVEALLEADIPNADMDRWRAGLARAAARSSAVKARDIEEYALSVREIQRIIETDDTTQISNPSRVVQEAIDSDRYDQILGQQWEAERTLYYAKNNPKVVLEPDTPSDKEPDLQVGREGKPDLYVENKIVIGDLEDGITLKDKIADKADGSFTGISGEHEEIVEISAQGQITDDFNPETTEPETPRESFKGIVEANQDPNIDIRSLPEQISGFENPDMVVRVIDENGDVIDGGEFSIRKVYQEVDNDS